MKQPWTIRGLYDAMQTDLGTCSTAFERSMCKAIGGREIREKAAEISTQRRLTKGELAIARQFGYRG